MTIAVDFDGTLCFNEYPRLGVPNVKLIEKLKERQQMGDTLILWTCRTDNYLNIALEWCKALGLNFNYVNDNTDENKALYGGYSRKVFADVYIDDRALSPSIF